MSKTAKVKDNVAWFEKRADGTEESITGVISEILPVGLAAPEPLAVVRVLTRYRFVPGYEEQGRSLPVADVEIEIVSTEIVRLTI